MALKATTERQRSLRELTQAVDLDLDEVLADVAKLLAGSGAENPVSAAQLGVLPRELLAHLHRLLEDLVHKDNVAVAGELDVRALARESREAFKSTRQELMRTRNALRNVYGDAQADLLLVGVPRGEIPRNVIAHLLRMCRGTLRQLRDPNVQVTMYDDVKDAYPLGKETFVTLLKKEVDNLRRLNRQLVRAQARLRGLQVFRRQAMEEYNRCFPDIARIFVSLYRLSGRLKLAKWLEPSGQEKGLLRRLVKLRRAIRTGLKEAKAKRQQDAAESPPAAKTPDGPSSD